MSLQCFSNGVLKKSGSRLSGLLPICTGSESVGGAHLAGRRGLQVFSVLRGCAGDYPILRGAKPIRNRTGKQEPGNTQAVIEVGDRRLRRSMGNQSGKESGKGLHVEGKEKSGKGKEVFFLSFIGVLRQFASIVFHFCLLAKRCSEAGA